MVCDKYDLLLASLGYGHPSTSEKDLIQNQEEISKLADEIGISVKEDRFDLFLMNDSIHNMIEVVLALYDLGLSNDRSLSVMNEAHLTGKSKIISGNYKKLKQMQDILRSQNYRTVIRKIDR
jgi:ATP-dependent Clp protease adapter protein ClpS